MAVDSPLDLPWFGPTVHVVRVSLRGVQPEVWRRVSLASDTPLPKFSQTLVHAMGWQGYHLHMFDAHGILFGPPDEDSDHMIDEEVAMVRHLMPDVGSTLRWDYDFGDGWEHDVVVEAIEPTRDRRPRTLCVDGARACPPEDCGGPYGYAELLDVIADPRHPRHSELIEWLPAGFDPEVFSVDEANRAIRGR